MILVLNMTDKNFKKLHYTFILGNLSLTYVH